MLALPSVMLKSSDETRACAAESATKTIAVTAGFSSPVGASACCAAAAIDVASVARCRRSAAAASTSAAAARAAAGAARCRDRRRHAYTALAVTLDSIGIDRGLCRARIAADGGISRTRQHLAEIVGVGTAKAWHQGFIGVGDAGRIVVGAIAFGDAILGTDDDHLV